ncbi:MAG TPA: SusC/RagA family TonB-linked outer membrane protein, partial [Bacteroidales bacterium]|nr:SusC/RagA family TonB-linked outer membrane protein [Bacteroidales bacterium]
MKEKLAKEAHVPDRLRKMLSGLMIAIFLIVSTAMNASGPSGTEQQQVTVSGMVTDASTGDPMPGVNVIIKGTTLGALTSGDGRYTITVPDRDATLVFSFIGYDTKEELIAGRTTINVTLTSTTTALDEVIVTGYGTQKKSDLTGSVVRVTMDQKATLANVNLSQALSGASAGVNVQASGLAGSEPSLAIRGRTSLSASDRPLIVLDGIIYNGAIADININDVESIDILKDASAAAVYGSRSANGVMIITTKKGRSEKPVISFNMYYGYQDMTNNPMRVMNAEEYAIRLTDYYYQQDLYTWYKTMPTSDAGKPVRPDVTNREIVSAKLRTQEERDNYIAGNEIDWVKEVLQIAPIQNYNLNVSGRSARSSYYFSGSYTDEEGIQLNDQFSRITLHTNLESKVTDWLTVGLISSYSFRDYSGIEASLGNARSSSPLADNKIGQPDYDMYLTGEVYMTYPLVNLFVNNKDIRNNLFLVGNAKITVPWITGLSYEFNYSTTYSNRNNFTFNSVTTPGGVANKGQAVKNPSEERNWIFNNIVTYLRNFGDHQINATLLYSRESRNAQSSTLTATGFDNEVLGYNNMGLGTLSTVASSAW